MGWWMNNQSRQALWLALAGSIVLMIGMGYGRFAFTGVLPLMLNEGLLTLHEGNLAASANYAGYLVGALLLARVQLGAATRLSIISAGLTIASLALLAWVSSPWTIITLRAVAGALSAITLIAGSLWLLEHMGHHHGAPLLYAGVGLGIFISAEGIALGHALSLTSQQIWLLCALCAGLLLALAIRWLLTPPAALVRASHVETSLHASGSDTRRGAWRLLMVYGLAGFGYIITATYLPLFLSGSLQSVDPVHLWALFGLAAAPSCLIWHKLVLKWGYRQALTRNLLVVGAWRDPSSLQRFIAVLRAKRAFGGLYLYGHRNHCATEGEKSQPSGELQYDCRDDCTVRCGTDCRAAYRRRAVSDRGFI